jgi:hypothetical protein
MLRLDGHDEFEFEPASGRGFGRRPVRPAPVAASAPAQPMLF